MIQSEKTRTIPEHRLSEIHLVGQRHDQPKRAILALLNIREDHISDSQEEVKGGGEADGQAYGQPPLWEELQWGVLQLC